MNRVEIKTQAKEIIKGYIWDILKPFLIIFVIGFGVSFCFGYLVIMEPFSYSIVTLLTSFVEAALGYGTIQYLIKFVRKENPTLNDLLAAKDNLLTVIVVTVLIGIFTTLWTLLLVVPGIIVALSYAMSYYILVDKKDMNALDVIKSSKKMMNGYKADYFVFQLSFFGWYLLCGITFGIALIWVIPYYSTAQVLYYEKLKEKAIL